MYNFTKYPTFVQGFSQYTNIFYTCQYEFGDPFRGQVMSTTIEDVAKKAGVSIATVSRALRGLPNVAPFTRERILTAAVELNYEIRPDISRKAAGRRVIGLILPITDQWFFGKLASTVEIQLIAENFDVIRYSIDSLDNLSERIARVCSNRLVDGLIVSTVPLSAQDVRLLKNAGIPTVTVETRLADFPSVSIDNFNAAALATRHLINLGHTRIGLISGLDDDPLHFSVPRAREQGYLQTLADNDIPQRSEYIRYGKFSYRGGAEAMKSLFSIHQPPTAVFIISDEMAAGSLKTISDMNLSVPEDVSLIGFDDNDLAEFIDLTTVKQPVVNLGEVAAQLIMEHFVDGREPDIVHQQLPVELVVRATTGPPPSK